MSSLTKFIAQSLSSESDRQCKTHGFTWALKV